MLPIFPDGRPFMTGAANYLYEPATSDDTTPRLLLQVLIEGKLTTAILDTGAPYVICAPTIARRIGLDPDTALERKVIIIRGSWVGGYIYRLHVELPASEGDALLVEATAFVPDPEWEEGWGDLPSFLGLSGYLERLRFAVDPGTDTFYFGPLA
jgi:hypothetical protein